MQCIIRDQAPREFGRNNVGTAPNGGFNNTDFEQDGVTTDRGIVGTLCEPSNNFKNCGKIGADRTPAYAFTGRSRQGTVRSPDSFYKWYHNSEQTKNENITLTMQQVGSSSMYQYSNSNFFPIDNKGWKDKVNGHNFAFCLETHAYFGYSGGEVFNFEGDDDVFVYINDMLVIDLGGVHPAQTASVALDTIPGLEQGKNYRFDFFYCERHTVASNLKIQTSLVFECAYIDSCGVCNGNGMSCCSERCPDDGNKCTIESCTSTGCKTTNKTCEAKPCKEVSCDSASGECVYTDKVCPNTDSCQINTCNLDTGYCQSTPKCNDGLACTSDTCRNGVCSFTSTCNDGISCTTDSCGADGRCVFEPIRCVASSKCKISTCNGGTCTETDKCNDGSLCTADSCDEATGQCSFTDLCDVGMCMNSTCNPAVGCIHKPVVCNDGSSCTTDSCNNRTGCVFTPIRCNDNNICTDDSCAPSSGCVFTNVTTQCEYNTCKLRNGTSTTCTSESSCYTPVCDPDTGCKQQWNCDDNDMCTTDTCQGGKCVNTPIGCSGATLCNPQECNSRTGICEDRNVTCTSPNACNIGTCVESTGRCSFSAMVCESEDPCFPQVCRNGACVADTPVSCTSENKCINSTCVNNAGTAECRYTSFACPQDSCNPTTCNTATGSCDLLPKQICDDQNPCTDEKLICANNTLTCDFSVNNLCDDNNSCTNDLCSAEADQPCTHSNITCEASNLCEVASCDPVQGCITTPLICPPSEDLCKTATCDPIAGCIYTSKVCPSGDINCFVSSCTAETGNCTRERRSNFNTAISSNGIACLLRYDTAAKTAAISAGAAAGIAIGAAAFVGLAGFGGKKGYDLYQQSFMAKDAVVSENPLYVQSEQSSVNPLFDPTEASH